MKFATLLACAVIALGAVTIIGSTYALSALLVTTIKTLGAFR